MLFNLVIAFLTRSKHLLISWLQSPSAIILEPPKIKSDTVSTRVAKNRDMTERHPNALLKEFEKDGK